MKILWRIERESTHILTVIHGYIVLTYKQHTLQTRLSHVLLLFCLLLTLLSIGLSVSLSVLAKLKKPDDGVKMLTLVLLCFVVIHKEFSSKVHIMHICCMQAT